MKLTVAALSVSIKRCCVLCWPSLLQHQTPSALRSFSRFVDSPKKAPRMWRRFSGSWTMMPVGLLRRTNSSKWVVSWPTAEALLCAGNNVWLTVESLKYISDLCRVFSFHNSVVQEWVQPSNLLKQVHFVNNTSKTRQITLVRVCFMTVTYAHLHRIHPKSNT